MTNQAPTRIEPATSTQVDDARLASTQAGKSTLSVSHFPPPVRTSALGAWLDAWLAVRARITAQEFLDRRLARYMVQRPQGCPTLPVVVTVEHGQAVHREDPEWRHPLAATLEDPSHDAPGSDYPRAAALRFLRAAHSVRALQVTQDLEKAENQTRLLDEQLADARGHELERSLTLVTDVQEGRAGVPATLARDAELRGRPALPGLAAVCVIYAAVGTVALLEAWQFALPYLNAIGIDTSNLGFEWQRNGLGILAGGAFAAGLSASLFVFFHSIVDIVVSMYRGGATRARTAAKAALALGLTGTLALTAWGISAMRDGLRQASSAFLSAVHGSAATGGSDVWKFFVFTLAVPFASAILLHAARLRLEKREAAREAQREWDAAQEALIAHRERDEALEKMAADARARLERKREQMRTLDRELWAQVRAEEEALRRTIDSDLRFAQAFAAAVYDQLMRDQMYFMRHARRRRLDELCGHAPPRAVLEQHAGEEPNATEAPEAPDKSGIHERVLPTKDAV